MGTWGTGIFDDDDAADVKEDYRDLVANGNSGEQATGILLHQWNSDPDNTVFWLALAATQWRCGRLEERVKGRALQIIESQADLERWKQAGDRNALRKRTAVLEHLRTQLTSPQPKQSKIRKPYRSTTDWERAELIAYKLQSGKSIIFRVLGVTGDKGGRYPVCEILDWVGDLIPDLSELHGVSVRRCIGVHAREKPQLGIGKASAKEYPDERITRLHVKIEPEQPMAVPRGFTLWRYLDADLAVRFGLR